MRDKPHNAYQTSVVSGRSRLVHNSPYSEVCGFRAMCHTQLTLIPLYPGGSEKDRKHPVGRAYIPSRIKLLVLGYPR